MTTRLDIDGARQALRNLGSGPVDASVLARYRELPVLLRRTGLIATLATVLSRGSRSGTGPAYTAVADALAVVIAVALHRPAGSTPADLLVALTEAGPADYIAAARRADHMLLWLKRLAEARHHATPGKPRTTQASAVEPTTEDA
ncbi:type III-B CRISPR module-associated protein Cmr5 [Amycolatopsis mediterranei]|uniref:type III-B CRISPR module-associated protein Cmr5 n=1 Tax=Amycolatopsis mediterranei TaxID=33910 RepID=UPI00341A98FB